MPNRLPLLAVVLLLTLPSGGSRPPDSLADRIEDLIDQPPMAAAFWGLYVQDLTSGRVLYQRNADKAFVPASNLKLFTTATALDVLGAGYRYQTTLHFDGRVDGAVLRGDLVLEGTGDPTFGSRRYESDPLRSWAAQLAEMGITRIEGRLIGDDDAFDDDAYAPGWDVTHVATEDYAPPRGGLAYRDNLVALTLRALRTGQPLNVSAEPPGFFTLQNQTTTVARRRGREPRLHVDRRVGTEHVRLLGEAPQTYEDTRSLPVADPTAFALHALRRHLQEAGIEVTAALIDVDDLAEKPHYDRAEPLFVYVSPPVAEIVDVINKQSDNLYAEQVFHTFGWGGTSEGGTRRVMETLARQGIPPGGLSVQDGSGLSRKNLVTPEAVVRLLTRMTTHPEADAFAASLPAGGEPHTTLDYRLRDVPVRAKTGSLEHARALSGYVTTPDGRTLVFAILANHYAAPAYRINQTIDSIVLLLTTTPAG